MDKGQSLTIPTLFDGTNYAYWKVYMTAFLQSLDEKVWQAMEIGWTKPMKQLANWDDAKIKAANFNSRALNALFSAVTNEEFKKISSIEIAMEAWTILQTTYEGAKAIKDSKLQRLTTSFKVIRMEQDESFDEFYVMLKDVVNLAFNFGETILEPKIVRKVLRSLLERFHAKIIAIEESKDIDKIPLTELVGNLQTNAKGFDKDRRQSSSSQSKSQDKWKKDARDGCQYTIPLGPKCFGCQGFGHMKQKCSTYLKTIGKSKTLATTLSDTKLEDDSDNEDDGILNAFTAAVNPTEGLLKMWMKKMNWSNLSLKQ